MNALMIALVLSASQAPADTVPLYDDLGDHHHTITTSSPLTQQYFDQGLRLIYAFNHGEAIASFRQALAYDDACAMCWWGIALAAGPNINLAMDEASGAIAYDAVTNAVRLAPKATDVERAYIDAISKRYDRNPAAARAPLDSAYARSMKALAARYPADDANVLYADALMNLTPWIYWTKERTPRAGTAELLEALETVSARNAKHAGACHLYIHAVEEYFPERAEPCADRLAGLMPGAGHIVHMPGHIYIRVGRYTDAIRANQHAIHEDDAFIADRNPEGVYPLGYAPHNHHFLNFAALMAANEEVAEQSATDMVSKATPELLRMPGLSGSMQHYLMTPLFGHIRFGHWDAILESSMPPSDLAYAVGLWRYARGVAYARKGDPGQAAIQLEELRKVAAEPELKELYILSYNNGAAVLAIAEATLAGETAAARGDAEGALRGLRRAVELQDGLVYIEPPEWPVPARQHLGRFLLEAGRFADAQAIWEEDLAIFKENVWSLRGLATSLEKQGRTTEAKAVHARIEKALAGSGPAGHNH